LYFFVEVICWTLLDHYSGGGDNGVIQRKSG